MPDPAADRWAELGDAIKTARKLAGFRKMPDWSKEVRRSTRLLYGLERGEMVGEDTLMAIEDALGWPRHWTIRFLSNAFVGPPPQDAGFAAFPDPAADPAERPVTERRLAEEMSRVFEALDRIEKKLPTDGP